MIKGFKDFVMGGNLIEVAVGLVMALAVFALVQALVADLVTPIIGAVVGKPDFSALSFTINGSEFLYGDFITALITFVSVAAAVYFLIVVPYEKIQGTASGSPPTPAPVLNARPRFPFPPRGARAAPHRWGPPPRAEGPARIRSQPRSRCPAPPA